MLIRSSSSVRAVIGTTPVRRSRSTRPPSSAMSRIMSSESTGVSCQPSDAFRAGTTNTPTGRSTSPMGSSCSPASANQLVGPDSPAPQIGRLERVWVREHPAGEVVGPAIVVSESAGERAALVQRVGPDARVLERDRQTPVRAVERFVEQAGRDHDRGPVKAGVAVGLRLAVDQCRDR